VDPAGLSVLVRSDLNVPLAGKIVGDDFRIRAALPTLEGLVEGGAAVTVCSHLGRPQGFDPGLSLAPIAERMNALSRFEVAFERPAGITVLENTRFLEGETTNSPEAADHLANGFDLFVQDAFGSVHRAHASTVGVAERVKAVAGPLLHAELAALSRFLGNPGRPYAVVLGGAKVSEKLGVIKNLLPKVDVMLIGGGMCFTLLAAGGVEVGGSLIEEAMIDHVRPLLEGPDTDKILLPTDVVVADRFAEDATYTTATVGAIGEKMMGLDIGGVTASRFAGVIEESKSVFWNGPMGVFEWEAFRSGTETVARAIARNNGFTAVGGGDSAAAVRFLGLESEISHLSTGGGAGLELLEGRELPGVKVLEKWV
jgi:phosphoglycerate kinase